MRKPEYTFDENLREVLSDPAAVRRHVEELRVAADRSQDLMGRVRHLGERGSWLRCLGDLSAAEQDLQEALRLIDDHGFGLSLRVQQRLRLAHVWQWQGRFNVSDAAYSELIGICGREKEANRYLDFAWQHAGKNFFDQGQYVEALHAFEEALTLRRAKDAPAQLIASSELAITRAWEKIGAR